MFVFFCFVFSTYISVSLKSQEGYTISVWLSGIFKKIHHIYVYMFLELFYFSCPGQKKLPHTHRSALEKSGKINIMLTSSIEWGVYLLFLECQEWSITTCQSFVAWWYKHCQCLPEFCFYLSQTLSCKTLNITYKT